MPKVYGTLRVAPSDEGVLGVVIDAPPMNLPDADLDAFVARLARRIASFPADAVRTAKRVLNELTLPGADAIRADASGRVGAALALRRGLVRVRGIPPDLPRPLRDAPAPG